MMFRVTPLGVIPSVVFGQWLDVVRPKIGWSIAYGIRLSIAFSLLFRHPLYQLYLPGVIEVMRRDPNY